MAHLYHKPTVYTDPATDWLMQQSKAALADMLTELLRCESGYCDEPASASAAESRFAGLLARRAMMPGGKKRFGQIPTE